MASLCCTSSAFCIGRLLEDSLNFHAGPGRQGAETAIETPPPAVALKRPQRPAGIEARRFEAASSESLSTRGRDRNIGRTHWAARRHCGGPITVSYCPIISLWPPAQTQPASVSEFVPNADSRPHIRQERQALGVEPRNRFHLMSAVGAYRQFNLTDRPAAPSPTGRLGRNRRRRWSSWRSGRRKTRRTSRRAATARAARAPAGTGSRGRSAATARSSPGRRR